MQNSPLPLQDYACDNVRIAVNECQDNLDGDGISEYCKILLRSGLNPENFDPELQICLNHRPTFALADLDILTDFLKLRKNETLMWLFGLAEKIHNLTTTFHSGPFLVKIVIILCIRSVRSKGHITSHFSFSLR